jgi:TPP-dependent pyruvate/acetoin dehydrogenase alpha subunit
MMAELFGKKTGYCKGKGGSMHIANFDKGILGASGVIGAAVEIATGAALSAKMRKTSQVAVCFFGDGASNRGPFHEAFNMAAIWKLPVIYVCENNLYAISERSSEYCASENIADRAVAYNMPGVIVDGNDVIEVYNAVGEAVERARKGGGPTLVECKTYRWRGHFEGEGVEVRPREEIEEWRSRCPIKRFRSELLETGVLTEDLANRLEEEARSKIEEAMDFAKESPFPAPEEAEEDLFA